MEYDYTQTREEHEAIIAEMQKLVEQYLDGETESIVIMDKDHGELKNLVANKGALLLYPQAFPGLNTISPPMSDSS